MDTSLSIIGKYPKDQYNLLLPIETVAVISEVHSPVINTVNISTNLEDKEIYEQKKATNEWTDKNKKHHLATTAEYALTKKGLTKLSEAAGIKQVSSEPVLPTTCQKCAMVNKTAGMFINCGQCSNKDVKYKVVISVPQLTGEVLYFTDHHEIIVDTATVGMSESQKKEFLKHLPQICEAKALNGAIRTALQIKGTYKIEEFKKPFIVAYLVPNMDHPDVKKAAIENMFQSTKALYGSAPAVEQPVHYLEATKEEYEQSYEDVEDIIDVPTPEKESEAAVSKAAKPEDRSIDFRCDKCDCIIPEKVWEYSVENFGAPLCFKHQKEAKYGNH